MIELAFIACLAADPTACERRTLSFLDEGAGAGGCMLRAQAELAGWVSTHPGFTIRGWKCQDASRHESDA